ncbi:hypothetical protein [Paenibacillus sp. UNC451MF]|uniref:hypothetical protein n=1 Tax=Paenibacillus sp. UNC451MF TaxID=1449063 RepID=UPI00068E4979|nr:hypothetical protein [Paenibacillus sp. UNC451MF]
MNVEHQRLCEDLRIALLQLFADAGYEHKGLLRSIEALERETGYKEELEQLTMENERLKEQVRRLRNTVNSKESSMSSKLREALRE